MSATPITPAELRGEQRRDLADRLDLAESVLIYGGADPDTLRDAALTACATSTALASSATRWQWLAQVAALEHGATLAEVAAASGADPDEVAAGLRLSVDAQRRWCGMTAVAAEGILALLDEDGGR